MYVCTSPYMHVHTCLRSECVHLCLCMGGVGGLVSMCLFVF